MAGGPGIERSVEDSILPLQAYFEFPRLCKLPYRNTAGIIIFATDCMQAHNQYADIE